MTCAPSWTSTTSAEPGLLFPVDPEGRRSGRGWGEDPSLPARFLGGGGGFLLESTTPT